MLLICLGLLLFQIPILSSETVYIELFFIMSLQSSSQNLL